MPNNERITPVAPDVRPMPETATIDGQPAWLASDVGVALGYQEPERVRWTAEAGREGFDPAIHLVYEYGEVYLTAEGVRHACSRRKRSKDLAARLLEHIETETAPRREWSTRECPTYVGPGKVTPSQPWPRRPDASPYYQHREAEKAKREEAARLATELRRRDGVASILFGIGGVVILCVGLSVAPQSIVAGGFTAAAGASTIFTAGRLWGSR